MTDTDNIHHLLSHHKASFYNLRMAERKEFFYSAVDQAYLNWGRFITNRIGRIDDEDDERFDEVGYAGPIDYLVTYLFNYMGLTAHFLLFNLANKYDSSTAYEKLIREWALMSISLPDDMDLIIMDLMSIHFHEHKIVVDRLDAYDLYEDRRIELLTTDDV